MSEHASADTIAALATPVGTSALAVIRASGPDCARVASEILGRSPTPRHAHYCDYRTTDDDRVLDDVLLTFFPGPHSYSGEDSLEISTHGNPLIAQYVLEDLLKRGMRGAEAGEFTRRAFLSGRLDLSQAEAVMDVIHARSERALAVARQQLEGSLGRHLDTLTEGLLLVLARIEAYIDFPDEDLPPEDRDQVLGELDNVLRGTDRLLATSHYGDVLRDGLKTVILGEPNAGKSSLLNRLIGRDRALVSDRPGTTRDFIEERILIGPHAIHLIDTAGLNPAPEELEKLGMGKTLECAADADLILWVVDASRPCPIQPEAVATADKIGKVLVIKNKCDLPEGCFSPADLPTFRVSVLTGAGFEEMSQAIAAHADAFSRQHGDEVVAINARHADALRRAGDCLRAARSRLAEGGPVELLASDLRGALDACGEICGRIDNERMLDHLFKTFCIGK
ncbi:MAG: tRNA uridine-5-carboxymethylaminomethyl(34) synthesis GTPase MnmE [Verrucomicrobiota bacterium]